MIPIKDACVIVELDNLILTWGDEHQLQTEVGDLRRVPVPVPLGQAAGHHVAVIDRLHLVHVIALNPDASFLILILCDKGFFSPGIKSFVKRVEEIEELKWRAAPSNDLEPDNDNCFHLGRT